MVRIKRWIRVLAVLAVLAVGLGLTAAGALYWLVAPRLPDVQELRHIELQVPMSVFSRDGKLIAQFGETRRYPVKIAQVPIPVRQAFIAIEDARFYHHHGLDFRGISRAIWLILTTDEARVPGGSTITQQVAKNYFLSSEYSYSRKFMEMLLALKMERELSKDEILELYLNKIFFGNRAYGVAAAAEYYYGKNLDQLTLAEAASLAAIPKFPSSANPIVNPERANIRRDYVLQRMREVGFINAAQEQAAQAEPNRASPHEPKVQMHAPYLAEMVRQAMFDRYGADAETSGYQVTTTVASADQLSAEKAVLSGLVEYDRRHGFRGPEAHLAVADDETPGALRARLRVYPYVVGMPTAIVLRVRAGQADVLTLDGQTLTLGTNHCKWTGKSPEQMFQRGDVIRVLPGDKPEDLELGQLPKAESALVSLDPEDGALRAIVGGLSFSRSKFNRVLQAQRQPGSSFKPFLYSAAFERGFTPASIVLDAPVIFKDRVGHVWRPQNDNGKFAGPMRMREALVQSRNLVSVRVLDAIGVDFARKYISRFGFRIEQLPANLSMSLGTASLTPMSMARAYCVFANGGYLIDPYFIERVVDRRNVTVMFPHSPRACRNCPERLATETRTAVVIDGFDFSAGGPSATAAAATVMDPSFVGPQMPPLAPRAIDERTAFLASSLMRDVVLRGTATAAKVLNREDIGGKTGSTNDHRDAWFSGFGGGLVTTVWVGNDNFSSLGYREYGGKAALPIWINYMRDATNGVPLNDFTPPAGIVTAAISPGSGNLLPEGTPGSLKEYFKQEDYDRLISSGYIQNTQQNTQESFDIF